MRIGIKIAKNRNRRNEQKISQKLKNKVKLKKMNKHTKVIS